MKTLSTGAYHNILTMYLLRDSLRLSVRNIISVSQFYFCKRLQLEKNYPSFLGWGNHTREGVYRGDLIYLL